MAATFLRELINLTNDEIDNIYTVFVMSDYNVIRANRIYAEIFPSSSLPEYHVYYICYMLYRIELNVPIAPRLFRFNGCY